VIYGHSHRELVDSTINGVLLVQPRNWAASVAVATLTIERSKDRWHVVSRRGQSVRIAGHAEDPRVLSASAGTHKAALEWSNASVGKTIAAWRSDSVRISDQPIVDFVAEVMRRATGAQLAATAAFSLDASLEPGAVTRAMLSRIYPMTTPCALYA
jgi:2',3'-cyclic-nucleotide 2'-phosphodiesterase (5'-nucleotidase family)